MRKTYCKLFLDEDNALFTERESGDFLFAHNVTPEQVLNIGKLLTSKYEKVVILDEEHEAKLIFENRTDEPAIDTYYPESEDDVLKKYSLYVEREEYDDTDLDKEKWDNYWGDYNQCGIHIDWT